VTTPFGAAVPVGDADPLGVFGVVGVGGVVGVVGVVGGLVAADVGSEPVPPPDGAPVLHPAGRTASTAASSATRIARGLLFTAPA
jgi:hypothetical protein